MKQDRQGVRKASDLERKYDLGHEDYTKIENMANNAQRSAEQANTKAGDAQSTASATKNSVDALAVRVEHLENCVVSPVFVNYADMIHTLEGVGQTWTATQDCYCVAAMGAYTEAAEVYVDGVLVLLTGLMTSESMVYTFAGNFYVKSGQVVSTKNVTGQAYSLKFYSLYKPETEGTEEE